MKLTAETFVLPDGDQVLVYAPLRRVILQADRAHAAALAQLAAGVEPEEQTPLIAELRACGVIDGPLEPVPNAAPAQAYQPTHVTLMLTSRCNLHCQYCFAEANSDALEMPLPLGEAAITFAADNSVRRKVPLLEISFHGGGEPTLAWDAMQHFYAFGTAAAEEHGLKLRASTITNGCIGQKKARWIAERFEGVSLSWDGPPDIQNGQRPTVGGGKSAGAVEDTVRIFDELGLRYGIQATVTAVSAPRMPELVRYFAAHSKTRRIKFEPVSAAGRFRDKQGEAPKLGDFAHWFNAASEVAEELGIELMFSAATRILGHPTCYFCGALSQPFAITPDGYISACYEVCAGGKEFEDIFIIGAYDAETGQFQVDPDRLATLSARTVGNMDKCSKCFCKYSCAGDCPARNMRDRGSSDLFADGARCEAIREISRHSLKRHLRRAATMDKSTAQPTGGNGHA
jgi:uncharacterized protein